MKITRLNNYRNKLLKLKLIQTKIYKKTYNNFIKIENISSRLKKAFHIIYKYHVHKKQILFVGTPTQLPLKFINLLKNTKHIFIPEYIWMTGILTNQKTCFKYLSKNARKVENQTSEILFKLKNPIDLIVVLDSISNKNVITEAYLSKIPVISLNCNLMKIDNCSSYKIPGNFKFTKKKVRDLFFYSILLAIFKKTKLDKC